MVTAGPEDSYSRLERRLKAPVQRAQGAVLGPLIRLLARLGISPHAVSACQVLLGLALFYTLPRARVASLFIWLAALLLDTLDGMLARALGRTSAFGALWDQACDHTREVLVVAALACCGLASPLWSTLYAFSYPALNVGLLLSNRYGVAPAAAIKSYLVFYPALVAYLGWGVNYLTCALALATLVMAAQSGLALWRLYKAMG